MTRDRDEAMKASVRKIRKRTLAAPEHLWTVDRRYGRRTHRHRCRTGRCTSALWEAFHKADEEPIIDIASSGSSSANPDGRDHRWSATTDLSWDGTFASVAPACDLTDAGFGRILCRRLASFD